MLTIMSNLKQHPSANGASPNTETITAPILWLPRSSDEAQFCQCIVTAGKPDKAFAAVLGDDFKDPHARRIYEAARAVFGRDEVLTVDSVAQECRDIGDDEDRQTLTDTWHDTADIVGNECAKLPLGTQNIDESAAKFAAKIGAAARSKRERRNEPTPEEIARTAAATAADVSGLKFAERPPHDIPAPALLTGEKPEYDPHQVRALLYPAWSCVSLETEKAHAERAAKHLGQDLIYCPELGFLHYNGARGFWRADDKDGSLTNAKLAALAPSVRAEAAALLRYAATLAAVSRDADARAMSRTANSLLSHAKQIEKRSFLSGAASFLAADLRAEIAQFAPTAWAFGFANGCAFTGGKVRPTARADSFLNVSPVALDATANRAEWLALLDRITAGDGELARTLQDAAAYAVSGAASLRALLWCYGPKGTGKSTFCELLQTLLGDAAATIDTALLQDNSSRERLGAALWGKRAAFVTEAGNKRIDAELLKTLSGGDRLSVRFLYREAFTATPSHCLILAANDAPKTDAYDDALKDRVIALPFVHPLAKGARLKFAGHKRLESARLDPNSALLKGFAAWVCDGLARLYKTQEIYQAPAVKAATAQFWADTDPVSAFWETVDADELRTGIAKTELRHRYEFWCQAEGARPLNRNQWARACQSHGLGEFRSSDQKTRLWAKM